jgi:prepilin-type N-terminal cleavage/methylation domain-containing protein
MTSPIGEMKGNKAFSLIEIVLVVAITGIILGLAVPNFYKAYSGFQLNKAADDLFSVSRWAQAMAIGQQCTYALSFSRDRRSYGLERVIESSASGQSGFESVKGSLGRRHMVPEAVNLVTPDRIEFYPDGTIDLATIRLNSRSKKIVLSSAQVRGMMARISDE